MMNCLHTIAPQKSFVPFQLLRRSSAQVLEMWLRLGSAVHEVVASRQRYRTFLGKYKLFGWVVVLAIFSLVLGCGAESPPSVSPVSTALPTASVMETAVAIEESDTFLPVIVKPTDGNGLTYQRADGNRVVEGQGNLSTGDPLDIVLAGVPTWVVATKTLTETVWAVTLDDGRVQAFAVAGGVANEVAIMPEQLPSGAPPLLQMRDGMPRLLVSDEASSVQTHSVFLPERGAIVTVQPTGSLVVLRDGQRDGLAVDALLDARILVDEHERLLFLSNPTERYGHGVLGDRIEASGITLVEIDPVLRVVATIEIAAPDVIEGIAPIWSDLDGDGVREIVVTLSNADVGAWVTVYSEAGEELATGPAIGQGFRWRHQLAIAPFGPADEVELVDVLTPHIGGTVEFYAWNEGGLEIVAQQAGYTSHVIGSRNLDMAVAGDFDGDGRVELLLPNQARAELGAIRRVGGGAEVVWSLAVDGKVLTNLAATSTSDGGLLVGVGRDDGVLRIWGQ